MKSILSKRIETLEDLLKDLLPTKKIFTLGENTSIDKTDDIRNKNMQAIIIGDKTPDGTYALIKLMPKGNSFHYALRELYRSHFGTNKYFNLGKEDDLILEVLLLVDRLEHRRTPDFFEFLSAHIKREGIENIKSRIPAVSRPSNEEIFGEDIARHAGEIQNKCDQQAEGRIGFYPLEMEHMPYLLRLHFFGMS